jgi:nucleoside-diphosphate-sugar epimerase
MKKTLLVTGGAGFIGSHLCDALVSNGNTVRVLDDLSVGREENIPPECEFIHGSVLDQPLLVTSLRGVDAILHQAGRVTIRGSVDQFVRDAETNLMGTLRLLEAAAQTGVKRFLYASSMAIYADSKHPILIPEGHRVSPLSPYGVSKLAAEKYLLLLSAAQRVEPVILRYFNTFGTRQGYTPYVGVITIFVTNLREKKKLPVFGDGLQIRDFVHVSDIVQANLRALDSNDAAGRIFNVGTGKGTTVLQIAGLLSKKMNVPMEIEFHPARKEELRNSIADISLASNVLGYKPETSLETQLDEVIRYICANDLHP